MKTAPKTAPKTTEIPMENTRAFGHDLIYHKDKIASITGNSAENLNSDEIVMASKFARYIEDMAPNVMLSNEAGANGQLRLYYLLNDMYGYNSSRFKTFYRWVLKTVEISRKKKGAFYDRYVMRFYSWMNISSRELTLYRRTVNLLIVTADLKLKQEVVKRVNISDITEYMRDQTAKNNILSYYYN